MKSHLTWITGPCLDLSCRQAFNRRSKEINREAAEAVVAAAVEEGARGTTRCVAEATPERRAECVDEQRERRKAREASRIEDAKRRGERLRKNAAERAGGART